MGFRASNKCTRAPKCQWESRSGSQSCKVDVPQMQEIADRPLSCSVRDQEHTNTRSGKQPGTTFTEQENPDIIADVQQASGTARGRVSEPRQNPPQQAKHYNKTAKDLAVLEEGDVVRMKPFRHGQKEWEKAVVQRRLDERSYEVDTPEGTYRRNRVHLRRTRETVPPVPVLSHDLQRYAAVPVAKNSITLNETVISREPLIIRRSTRQKKRPARLADYVQK